MIRTADALSRMRSGAVRVVLILSFLSTAHLMCGQESTYRWEVGAEAGISGYAGDLNHGNPFSHPGFRGKITGGYLYDSRWSFRGETGISTISGRIEDAGGEFPEGTLRRFRSTLGEVVVKAEFNFLAYGEGESYKRLSCWTPYAAAGGGVMMVSPQDCSASVCGVLPLAAGVKVRLAHSLNLRVEVEMTKCFSDGVDGAGDLYGIKGSRLKNTDWTSGVTVGITYEFGERCLTCHYFD